MKSVLNTKVLPSPRLWLVTRGAQPVGNSEGARVVVDQAVLWGAGRVVGEEHPNCGADLSIWIRSPVARRTQHNSSLPDGRRR